MNLIGCLALMTALKTHLPPSWQRYVLQQCVRYIGAKIYAALYMCDAGAE